MSKVAKTTISLMIVTMISKILGFGKELVLGSVYGASIYSDIYITASNIPGILFSLIGVAISTTFIPLYYENRNLGGEKKAIEFSNNIFNIVLIICLIISILGFLFAEPLVKVFAMGFEGRQLEVATKFTRITIFGGIFLCISNVMVSLLQINDKFTVTGLIGLPFNIVIIISILLSYKINIILLPIGTFIAMFSQFLFQYFFVRKLGYRHSTFVNLRDPYIKKMIVLVGPVFIGVAVNQINAMIDRTLASRLAEGSISALNYANKLNNFVLGMFIVTIAAVIYPMLSDLEINEKKEKFYDTIVKSINSVILLVIPISVGAITLSLPIVRLLFERGAFDSKATYMTSLALISYSIGMIGFGLREVLSKVFYSMKDTKTPMVNGAISMIINIILNLILVKYLGMVGLALATSISAIICIVLMFISLNKRFGNFGQKKIILVFVKSLVASIIMGVATYYMYTYVLLLLNSVTGNEIISLFSSIIIGAIIYSLIMLKMNVEEVELIISMLRQKIIKKNKSTLS